MIRAAWPAAGLLACLATVARADPPTITGQLEGGTELDTNAHRVTTEGNAAETAPDLRAGARLALSWRPSPQAAFRATAMVAGKVFMTSSTEDEDVAVAGATLAAAFPLGAVAPGLRASYDEAAQPSEASDTIAFRAGDAALTLALGSSSTDRIVAAAGWRLFHYKPDPSYDFGGETLAVSYTHGATFGDEVTPRELSVGVAYAVAHRGYDSPALANTCADGAPITGACLVPAGMSRDDLFHDVALDLSYTSSVLLGLRYELQILDSNSFGQSLARHRVELSVTFEPVGDWFLHLRGVLVFEQHLDPLLLAGDLGTYATIEEETRNMAVVHLTHDLGERVTAEARWAVYSSAFASQTLAYTRQTFYLGLVVRI